MKTTATNKKIRVLITSIKDGKLIPRPDFQRRLVWNNKDKCNFLETILNDYPFPEIYIAAGDVDVDTGEAHEMLVDGQQRISTIYQYFTGSTEIKLPANIKPYCELSHTDKENFLEYDVVVRDLGKVNIEKIREVFSRINATRYALNAMEINNARFEGEYKEFAEKIAQRPFFEKHNVFSAVDIRRMQDTRYALTIITTILSTYFNRDDEVENYLIKYNDEFPLSSKVEKEVISILELIEKMNFHPSSRVWQKSDLFTLIIELHTIKYKLNMDLDPTRLAAILNNFYNLVENFVESKNDNPEIGQYYKAALQATNDRSNRIARGDVIRKLISNASS